MNAKLLQSLLIFLSICVVNTFSFGDSLGRIDNQLKQADTTVYMVVQVPPKFPGGDEAMFQFIQSASRYPINLKKGLLVQLKLLIEKDGSISRVQVSYANANNDLVQEAIRIAKTMPKWIPGSQDGRLLRVFTLVPIRFVDIKK